MIPSRRLPENINWLPALAFLAFGAVFLYASLNIPQTFGGNRENRIVPLAASLIIFAISAWQLHRKATGRKRAQEGADEFDISPKEFFLFTGPLILLVGFCGVLQIWFGYVIATASCGFLAFRLFGNSWAAAALHAAAGTAVLYFLFFRVLKLYDAPGSILDVSGLF